jgi:hypothetical protein
MSERDQPVSAFRTHVPDLERLADNQKPKTRDWTYLCLLQYDGTDLFQWFGKRNGSCFEDQASEPFRIPARRTPAPEGEACPSCNGVRPEFCSNAFHLASPVVPAPEGEAWTARHIVFDGPPDHNGPRFIEVETPEGKSVNAGEWRRRPDNLWELVIASPVVPVGVSREEIARALFERHWSAVSASPKWPGDDDGSYWLWLADAILAALRPADTGANHD